MRDRIIIGVVRSVHPGRRQLRVIPASRMASRFEGLDSVWALLDDASGTVLRCRVDAVRKEAGEAVLTISPGTTRDTLARMRGVSLAVAGAVSARQRCEELNTAEYVGLQVRDRSGQTLGHVVSAYAAGGNTVIEVARTEGGRFLAPVISQTIYAVDVDRGEVIVNDLAPYAVEEDAAADAD